MSVVKVRDLVIGEGIPKICVPIVEKIQDDILHAAKHISTVPADLVEWRVDWFANVFDINAVKDVLAKLRSALGEIPLLFTFRTKAEGGEREIAFNQYRELLLMVAETNMIDMVDVEVYFHEDFLCVEQLIRDLQKTGVIVVGSNHDFDKTPDKEELVKRLCYMQSLGVDIPKIAVMPNNQNDVLTLLAATEEMISEYANRPIVTMSMAGMGVISRIAGETFGSSITFATAGKASAPGQIDANNMRNFLEIMHHSHVE